MIAGSGTRNRCRFPPRVGLPPPSSAARWQRRGGRDASLTYLSRTDSGRACNVAAGTRARARCCRSTCSRGCSSRRCRDLAGRRTSSPSGLRNRPPSSGRVSTLRSRLELGSLHDCSRVRCPPISKTCSATRRSTCSRSRGRRSMRVAVVQIGRTRASTSRPCCTCSLTGSTTTRGCCSRGAVAAVTNSSTRCELAQAARCRRAGRRSPRGGHSVMASPLSAGLDAHRDGASVEPPDPPDGVLRRLAPLDVDVRGEPASDLLVGRVRGRGRLGRRRRAVTSRAQ